ncbi:MAG: glutaredoxin 3 [bacterium]
MQKVTIYTRPLCIFCARAISLLKKKNVNYTEINAGFNAEKKREMIQKSGGAMTFPQIFIGDKHIGGCDELYALEREGKLDSLLAGENI